MPSLTTSPDIGAFLAAGNKVEALVALGARADNNGDTPHDSTEDLYFKSIAAGIWDTALWDNAIHIKAFISGFYSDITLSANIASGYYKVLRWDGSWTEVIADGYSVNLGTPSRQFAAGTYAHYAIFPCDVNGKLTFDSIFSINLSSLPSPTSLDITNQPALLSVYTFGNSMSVLDLTGCGALLFCDMGDGSLTSVVGAGDAFPSDSMAGSGGLDVSSNELSTEALNALFTSLSTAPSGFFVDVSDNPGSATCDPTIATAKGWSVITGF